MPFAPEGKYGGRIAVTPIDDVRWRLLEPVCYVGGEGDKFLVPEGYITDFASVPRIASWLIPRYGRYTGPAILHDYLLTDALKVGRINSIDADGLFRRAMREQGVPPVKRRLMWAGVRWGAAFSSARREGWWSTAPAVLAISAAAFVPMLIATVVIGALLVLYGFFEFIATGGRKTGTLST